MHLQKSKHKHESKINTSALSLYTVYCFILNVESRYFLHILLSFLHNSKILINMKQAHLKKEKKNYHLQTKIGN